MTKFRLKLNKVGKTTRPFTYDLNQIPYNYTVEVRNRFKGLDLMDRVPDELWNEVRPKPCPASSVRAREGAGCGSVGAVSGA